MRCCGGGWRGKVGFERNAEGLREEELFDWRRRRRRHGGTLRSRVCCAGQAEVLARVLSRVDSGVVGKCGVWLCAALAFQIPLRKATRLASVALHMSSSNRAVRGLKI